MTLHLVALADCAPQPWRNGGGTTRELLAWPTAAAWRVRVSVATIARSGPFSAFPGVQRVFAVLSGAGVTLELPHGPCRVTPADAPVFFDGAAAPGCALLNGPTEDLNLMAPHEAGRPRLCLAPVGSTLAGGARWRALYAVTPATLDAGSGAQPLAAGTLAWSEDAQEGPWRLIDGARAYWLVLEP